MQTNDGALASPRGAQALIGVGALAVAALLALGATQIPGESGYSGVGPNFLPWVAAAALALCGLLLVVRARRSGGWADAEAPSGAPRGDWAALAWVSAGILLTALLMTRAGFIVANTLGFVLAVRGLRVSEGRPGGGAAATLRDAAIGVAIAAPVYWLFTKLLAIGLPGLTGTGWL